MSLSLSFLLRQRLCPNSQDLLYTDPNLNKSTCYPEHSQDPCPHNMVLYEKPGNQSLGVCDCDFIHNDRGLVYNKEWNKCFFIFSQVSDLVLSCIVKGRRTN